MKIRFNGTVLRWRRALVKTENMWRFWHPFGRNLRRVDADREFWITVFLREPFL